MDANLSGARGAAATQNRGRRGARKAGDPEKHV